jgi:hypothetical protein
MRDIPEFAHLKDFEEIFKQLEGATRPRPITDAVLAELADRYSLKEEQKKLLAMMLREKGLYIY